MRHIYLILLLVWCSFSTAQAQKCQLILDRSSKVEAIFVDRFKGPIEVLQEHLNEGKTLEGFIDVVIKKDGRGSLFRIEGLFRLYENIFEDAVFHEWRMKVKALEDAFGHYGDIVEIKKFYEENLRGKKGFDDKSITAELELRVRETKAELVQTLKRDGWYSSANGPHSPTLSKIIKVAGQIDWYSQKKDRNKVLKAMRDDLIKSQETTIATLEGLRFKKDDPREVLEPFHKLRRNLRWTLIDMMALSGFFLLDDDLVLKDKSGNVRLGQYLKLLKNPKYTDSPFSKLPPNSLVVAPVKFPTYVFYALSYFVNETGRIKGWQEKVVGISELIAEISDQADSKKGFLKVYKRVNEAVRENEQWLLFSAQAKAIFEELNESELLDVIIDFLNSVRK